MVSFYKFQLQLFAWTHYSLIRKHLLFNLLISMFEFYLLKMYLI